MVFKTKQNRSCLKTDKSSDILLEAKLRDFYCNFKCNNHI